MQEPEKFRIPSDVLVVGVENGDNFRLLHRQRHLFRPGKYSLCHVILSRMTCATGSFRFPMITCISAISTWPAIHIYLTEFYKYLGKPGFFLCTGRY